MTRASDPDPYSRSYWIRILNTDPDSDPGVIKRFIFAKKSSKTIKVTFFYLFHDMRQQFSVKQFTDVKNERKNGIHIFFFYSFKNIGTLGYGSVFIKNAGSGSV
jgi:hypothetical protein